MFVSKRKILVIPIVILLIQISQLYAGDLEIKAINYKVSSSRLICQILIKNTTSGNLCVITPNDVPFINISKEDNLLTIQTFSQKNLEGDFSFNDDIIEDNPKANYDYCFYTEVKSNGNLVLFFDIDLNNSICIDSEISTLFNYDYIKIQYLYSNSLINKHLPLLINEFIIDLNVKEKNEFDILDYKKNWDSSIIYLETKEQSKIKK